MDQVMQCCRIIYESHNRVAGTHSSHVEFVWKNTASGSPLRRVFLQCAIRNLDVDTMEVEDCAPSHMQEYWVELAKCAIKEFGKGRRNQKQPWSDERCKYHEHPGEEDSYSCTHKDSVSWNFCYYRYRTMRLIILLFLGVEFLVEYTATDDCLYCKILLPQG